MIAPSRSYRPSATGAVDLLRAGLAIAFIVAVGALLATTPIPYALLGLGGMLAVLGLLRHPWLALCGLAFAVPFAPTTSISVGTFRVGAPEALLAAMLLTWFLREAMGDDRPIRLGGLGLAVGAALVAALIAILPARDLAPAAKDLTKWMSLGAVFFFASTQLTASQTRWVCASLLIGAAAQGVLGIYQFASQTGPEGFEILGRFMRAHGTFGQPNPYAGYLGLLLPLAYGIPLGMLQSSLSRDRVRETWLLVALACASAAPIAAGLVLSWSRGALLGAVAAAFLVLLASGRGGRMGLLAVAAMGIVAWPWLSTLVPQGAIERLGEGLHWLGADLSAIEVTDANFAVIERLAHWLAAWRMFEQQPWTGVGLGQYATIYPQVAIPRWSDPLGHAHNLYLHVLAEQGLIGMVGLAAFVGGATIATWRALGRTSGWRRGLVLGCLGMLAHLMVHSLVDLLFVQGIYLLIGTILGLMVACSLEEPAVGTRNCATQ
jgi:putative inorganic carbon (hco3(-)) transporter